MRELNAHETQAVSGGGKGWGKLTNPNNPNSDVAKFLADPQKTVPEKQLYLSNLIADPTTPSGHAKKLTGILIGL